MRCKTVGRIPYLNLHVYVCAGCNRLDAILGSSQPFKLAEDVGSLWSWSCRGRRVRLVGVLKACFARRSSSHRSILPQSARRGEEKRKEKALRWR